MGLGGGQGGVKDVFPVRPWKGRMLGELDPVHPVGELPSPSLETEQREHEFPTINGMEASFPGSWSVGPVLCSSSLLRSSLR